MKTVACFYWLVEILSGHDRFFEVKSYQARNTQLSMDELVVFEWVGSHADVYVICKRQPSLETREEIKK